jgi:hypothetical protein
MSSLPWLPWPRYDWGSTLPCPVSRRSPVGLIEVPKTEVTSPGQCQMICTAAGAGNVVAFDEHRHIIIYTMYNNV